MKRDDRFSGVRRRFLLAILPLMSMAGVIDLLKYQATGTAIPLSVYTTILVPLALESLLWRKRRSLGFVQLATTAWVVATLFHLLYTVLFVVDQAEAAARFSCFSPWFAVSLVAIFLVFGPNKARWITAGVYLAALGFGLAYLVSERLRGQTPALTQPLLHLYLANAAFILFLFSYASVSEQFERTRTLARSMADLAHTDPLLGIANRRQLACMIQDEVTLAEEGVSPCVLIMFDLDRFKELNDTFGHETGDTALQTVTRAVSQTLRGTDRFGRWGGDEFIVLASVTDLNQANMLAQRLREAVQEQLGERFWRVTISLGIAPYHRGDTVSSWVRRADQALYRAKESGRNRVVIGS